MQDRTFDIAIIGAGVSGVFAAYKLVKDNPNLTIALFDIGRPAQKRRVQMCGFGGLLPFSDGKLYLQNEEKLLDLTYKRKINSAKNFVFDVIQKIDNKIITIKDKSPTAAIIKNFKKFGYQYYLNDYLQLIPKHIHQLSRILSGEFEKQSKMYSYFDTEITQLDKKRNWFHLTTENNLEFKAKKVIIAAGRSGWRWTSKIFNDFQLKYQNNITKFGIRMELDSSVLKDFNYSNLTLLKDNLEIGPFSWSGTVIPEDHIDMAIASFRSNEERWKSDRVSFNIIGSHATDNYGYQQADRIANLTFILTNERVHREKLTLLLNKKGKISIMQDYNWLIDTCHQLNKVIPDLTEKAYFYVPLITPMAPQIKLTKNFESEVEGMYCIGESAGVIGLWSAMLSGTIVANGINNEE